MIDRKDLQRRLYEAADHLNDDELSVVVNTAERLERGAATYGRLRIDGDGRNWIQEIREELLDAVNYASVLTEKLKRLS